MEGSVKQFDRSSRSCDGEIFFFTYNVRGILLSLIIVVSAIGKIADRAEEEYRL